MGFPRSLSGRQLEYNLPHPLPLARADQSGSGLATRAVACLRVLVVVVAALSLMVSLAGRTFAYSGDQHGWTHTSHDPKRQQLERDSHDWSPPVARFVLPLWRMVAIHFPPPSEPAIAADVQSPLYNRPPPPAC